MNVFVIDGDWTPKEHNVVYKGTRASLLILLSKAHQMDAFYFKMYNMFFQGTFGQ